MMGGRSYPSHVNQVSIWHRDITLVTPRQLKAGQKYSQYQRQAADAGQARGHTRHAADLRQSKEARQGRQSRQPARQPSRQARHTTLVIFIYSHLQIETCMGTFQYLPSLVG